MSKPSHEILADFLAEQLAYGLRIDAATRDFFLSTFGEEPVTASLRQILADRDQAESAVFCSMLMDPSQELKLALETVLAGQGEQSYDEDLIRRRILAHCRTTRVEATDGQNLVLSLESDDIRDMLARLRLNTPPPALLAVLIRKRFRPASQGQLLMRLRHAGLSWSADRVSFLESLLGHIELESPDMVETLVFALGLLGIWPEQFDAQKALQARYEELNSLLKRAQLQAEIMGKSNFETMAMQGLRVVDLSVDNLSGELRSLRQIAMYVLGYEVDCLSTGRPQETELGHMEQAESVIQALTGLGSQPEIDDLPCLRKLPWD